VAGRAPEQKEVAPAPYHLVAPSSARWMIAKRTSVTGFVAAGSLQLVREVDYGQR
jgi:hypothetical protein